ncbi:site-specific integrase, partial [Candidatus Gracilibacteria bacterium]
FYFEEKNDIATVMKILNHSSMQSTLRYIGIEKERILEVYENFNI